jgi:hypothetical protein
MSGKGLHVVGTDKTAKSIDEMEALLEELPASFLLCRDIRHSWTVGEDFHLYPDVREPKTTFVARSLVCSRCHTERVTVYRQGRYRIERERTFYRYAEGYQLHNLPTGMRPNDLVEDVQFKRAASRIQAEIAAQQRVTAAQARSARRTASGE